MKESGRRPLTLTVLGRGFSHLVMVWPGPVCGALMYLQSVVLCRLPPPKHGARSARSPPGSLYYSLIGMTGGELSNLGSHHSGHSSHCLSVSTFFFFSEKMETSSCRNINIEPRLALVIHTYTHKDLYRYTWKWRVKNTYTVSDSYWHYLKTLEIYWYHLVF